ncbi:DUF2894 domain-containing protein [Bordetella sp. 02P26C-1]|uniref:DUF2894 domain-containing protein n=1 Tax=Bordetella sp. 02P26C-1 TaxID=2683195 RepID=UPI0013549C10|nr:DUF2894 domain-containing protein [Bordetella sp. 02P26C-1]
MTEQAFATLRQTLQAWREQGLDRIDVLSFSLMDTLLARAEQAEDERVRRVLQARLRTLVERYALRIEAANVNADADADAHSATQTQGAPEDTMARFASLAVPHESDTLMNLRGNYPELPVLDEFRAIWSRVSANRRIQQSEEQVHENAGPLNSGHLVHRTLSFMRDVSPGYLHQFLSYLDDLAWVEQLHVATAPPPKETKRSATKTAKKSAARKTTRKAS